jgi:hypothetical protein
MTPQEALEAINASLLRESATPTLGADDRNAYLREQGEALRSSMVEPVLVRVVASTFEHGLTAKLSGHAAYAVARDADKWLGFCPELGEFFLAYGSSPDQLKAWGFSSDDALAEWLG